ncbi:MAG: laminin G domain-containing protein [Nocardioides sp.]
MARVLIATLAGTLSAVPLLLPTAAHAATVEASWQMNEPANATTMLDSSGNGLNGAINQAGLDTGIVVDGATGYRWAYKGPNSLPVAPERIINVADNARLDPMNDTYTLEIRFRTSRTFGNIVQKGQSATPGGQVKIQNPQGRPSCLFKGPSGQVGVRAVTPLNNNVWHTLRCVKTSTNLTMYVDGVYVGRKTGTTGIINNNQPYSIGGKTNCDQVVTTCDYYTGDIDYITITRG